MELFAPSESDFQFDFAVVEIELRGNHGQSLLGDHAGEVIYLADMKEQFAVPVRILGRVAGVS